MSEIIDFEGKRGERERARLEREQEKSFSEIERDFNEEALALFMKGCPCSTMEDIDGHSHWWSGLSKRQQAKILLDQAAKVHDLAKRLMEAATREEQDKAS